MRNFDSKIGSKYEKRSKIGLSASSGAKDTIWRPFGKIKTFQEQGRPSGPRTVASEALSLMVNSHG